METLIQGETEISKGQRVTTPSFGEGMVAEVSGDVVTVRFEGGDERKIKADYLQAAATLDELRCKFREAWVRGTQWRLEVGELLYKIKRRCAHGEWGAFLNEYELARSTADDYVRRYEDEAQIAVPRQFSLPEPDPQADQRDEAIAEEKEKRQGKRPTHHQSELHVRVKGVKPYQLDLYREERTENRERVEAIWHRAFLEIIHVEEITQPVPDGSLPDDGHVE